MTSSCNASTSRWSTSNGSTRRTQEWLRDTIRTHLKETDSPVAEKILKHWHTEVRQFRKVMPKDYRRVLDAIAEAEMLGLDVDEAVMRSARS